MLSAISGVMLLKVMGIVALSWLPFKMYHYIQFCLFPDTKDKIRKEGKEKAKRIKKLEEEEKLHG